MYHISGPDRISPLLLKSCYNELAGVYQYLFQLCVDEGIPNLWKTATIIPVPKKAVAKEFNDYRPIALTSVPFKCLERIILKQLLYEIDDKLDQCQFAYRKNKSTDDATLLLNNIVTEHLENKNAYVRSLFIDFSSAFNTIKPDIVVRKLKSLQVSPTICAFILDFLTNRLQKVCINNQYSSSLSIDTGGPQGCVLSAVIFITYTNDLKSSYPNCRLIKYADDTVITGLISDNQESDYINQISDVCEWCKSHNLLLNVTKTKEVIFDFRHSVVNHLPLTIDNSPVDICDSFKYLGVTFDNKLNWSDHAALIVSKCKQRLFFLRLLNSFNINSQILHLFYTSMIESVISYNITLWWCSMSSADKKSISRIHKQAHKIVKLDITSIDEIYTRNITKKVKHIISMAFNACSSSQMFL